jgi:hypothetical protein
MGVPPKAEELVALAREAGRQLAVARRQFRATVQTMFIPQYVVAQVLEVDPSTIRRWFYRYPQLREHLAVSPHYTSVSTASGGQRTLIDGMLWKVRIGGRGEVRFALDELKGSYRNLDLDIAQGRTRTLHESQKTPTGAVSVVEKVKILLAWALGAPDITLVGSSNDACSRGDDVVDEVVDFSTANDAPLFWEGDLDLDRVEEPVDEVPELVREVVTGLNDQRSVRFWIRECRRWVRAGKGHVVRQQLRRVLTNDLRDGFARNPAAMLVRWLRRPAAGATGSA